MNIETERKFLVRSDSFKAEAVKVLRMKQGYIAQEAGNTVRIRISGDAAWLTVKGPSSNGISRFEWEREIPIADAEELMALCRGGIIDKSRYIVPESGGRKFEVDVFYGDNEGLVMAEIELGSEDETFERPSWLGDEVTGDKRYYNAHLLSYPFKAWK